VRDGARRFALSTPDCRAPRLAAELRAASIEADELGVAPLLYARSAAARAGHRDRRRRRARTQPSLSADRFEVLQTAVHYQFFHALGLLGLGLLSERVPRALLHWAGWLVFAGVVLFSGSLYLLVAGAPRLFGVLTPIGGLALIAGWSAAALALAPGREP